MLSNALTSYRYLYVVEDSRDENNVVDESSMKLHKGIECSDMMHLKILGLNECLQEEKSIYVQVSTFSIYNPPVSSRSSSFH